MTTYNTKYPRLLSLDVFRGLTVALMILVNSPGNQTSYFGLDHSTWNGCTLADLVFPFFIFIVGVSLAFTLTKAREHKTLGQLFPGILKRSLILFSIGLFLNAFPHHFDLSTIRFFGVLQRIAICYFAAAMLFLTTRISTQAIIMLVLMGCYWLLMTLVPVPGYGAHQLTQQGNLATYLDALLFSPAHLYKEGFDPEGLLSTLPAISTVLLGNLTGAWLLSKLGHKQKLAGLYLAGFLALIAGWLWGLWFPINKSLWTSSYVLWTGGFALLMLASCYWLIEMKSWKKWARPFEIFGVNAMLAYVLHVLFLKIQAAISMPRPDGTIRNLRIFITEHCFAWTSLENASLLYACSYTILWYIVIKLYIGGNKHATFR